MDKAFVEAEIAYPGAHPSVLDEECAVTGHAGKNLLIGIDFANVPETRHQHASIGGRDHLLHSLRILRRTEDDIAGHLTHFIWERKAVAGSDDRPDFRPMLRLLHAPGGAAGIDNALDYSILDQGNTLATHAFAIEGRSRLQGMGDVVGDVYVTAEQLGANAVVEERALIQNGLPTEIPEHEANDIEYRGGFEDHRIFAGRDFAW